MSGGNNTNRRLQEPYIFGMNCDVKQDVQFYDRETIYYTAGQFYIKYMIQEKIQDFGQSSSSQNSITALCLSERRNMIAVALKGEKVSIKLMRTERSSNSGNSKAILSKETKIPPEFDKKISEISYISFSFDETKIITLSTEIVPILLIWEYESQSLQNIANFQFSSSPNCVEVKINPMDSTLISVMGKNNFKLLSHLGNDDLSVVTNSISFKINQPTDFVCHTWLYEKSDRKNRLVVATESRKIYCINEKGFCVETYDDLKNKMTPTCICSYEEGFIVGGEGLKVYIFKMNEDLGQFQNVKELKLFDGSSDKSPFGEDHKENYLTSIHIDSATNPRILVVTEKRSMYYCDLPILGDDDEFDHERGAFKLVCDPGHSDRITCSDLCLRKPYVVTCSKDKTLKVWSYEEKKRGLIFYYPFIEEIVSVAFHPSGYHVVVAFTDEIKFLNLYMDYTDLSKICYREIATKNCSVVKFSNGGGLLAVASGAQAQTISIYKFYSSSSSVVHLFKGHPSIITSLVWSVDDMELYSSGTGGSIYKWNMRTADKDEKYQNKTSYINHMVLSSDNRTIVYVSNNSNSLHVGNKFADSSTIFSTVSITNSNKMIFTGVKEGQPHAGGLKFIRNPLQAGSTLEHYNAHNYKGVVTMMITRNDEYLITCGGDGTIIIFKVQNKENKDGNYGDHIDRPCNNILVTRKKIEDHNIAINGLNTQLNDEKNQGLNKADISSEIESSINRTKSEIASMKKESSNEDQKNQKEIEGVEVECEAKLKEMEAKSAQEIKDLDVYYNGEISTHQEKIKDLIRTTEEKEEYIRREYEAIQRQHQSNVEEIKKNFENELLEKREEKKRLEDEIQEMVKYNLLELDSIEEEMGKEYDTLEKKYEKEVEVLENTTIKLKNSKLSNEKKLSKHTEAIETLKENIKEKKKTQAQLENNKAQLVQKNKELEKILEEKNNKITLKEKSIYELKRRTQELEKYKFVLDFKIKELKMDIIPKQAEIKNLRLQTTLKDKKLKRLNAVNNKLGAVVQQLDNKQVELNSEIAKKKIKIKAQSNKIRNFKNSLYDAVQDILNEKILQKKLKAMNNNKIKKQEINENIFKEYQSQLRYLETSVNMLKKNLDKDKEIHKQDTMRLMKKNVHLIKEINQLRSNVNEESKTDKHQKIGIKASNPPRPYQKNKKEIRKPGIPPRPNHTDGIHIGHNKKDKGESIQEMVIRAKKKRYKKVNMLKTLIRDVKLLEQVHNEEPIEVDCDLILHD